MKMLCFNDESVICNNIIYEIKYQAFKFVLTWIIGNDSENSDTRQSQQWLRKKKYMLQICYQVL